jgi:hypothetical protein
LHASAAFAGAFIDKEVESHGLDFVDKEKAKYDGTSPVSRTLVFGPHPATAHKKASEAVSSAY